MRIQRTKEDKPTLYLVATPIGNFLDMTYRSVETLKSVDMIFCEDTRVTKVLLSHFDISTPLSCYHIFNEDVKCDEVLDYLEKGKNVALVSDAGLPGISDPGYFLVRKVLDNGFSVVSLPGASASLTALIASGIPCDKFYFYGFLDHKNSQKKKELELLRDFRQTIIFYEAPHRIKETLLTMLEVLGNREIVIARELTKKFEEYVRGSLKEIVEEDLELKGEIVIILRGASNTKEQEELNSLTINEHFAYYMKILENEKEAMKKVAKDRGISKSEVYKEIKVNSD